MIHSYNQNVCLQHQEILENRRFPDLFRGYRSGTLVENGLIAHNIKY